MVKEEEKNPVGKGRRVSQVQMPGAGASFPQTFQNKAPLVTVIVPVYNEERTVDELLRRLVDGPYSEKEIIVVDDGSTDGTTGILERRAGKGGIVLLRHVKNQGKGAAVRTGLGRACGEITIIQDGDLEYDPGDFPKLIETIGRGESDVVYGSRYLQPNQPLSWSGFRLGVAFLNLLVRFLYGQRLTDEATCYKALRTQLMRDLDLQSTGFEICAEMTAKLLRRGHRIAEVPISYHPRTVKEGKKIRWRDGWKTVWTLIKWRFITG